MGDAANLKLLSQSFFVPGPVSTELIACCPTIDLSVTVNDGDELYVRRRDGEIVSKHTERGKHVQALRWKTDGQFLAVGWSDGVVRLMGLENSKAVHHIRISEDKSVKISYIGWSRNLTGKRKSGQAILSGSFSNEDKKELLDLPHELTFLEIDTALPKISPLPVSGGSGDDMFVFSTRTSLEFVFQPPKARDNDMVDVMVVGTSDSAIHLSIYDTFVIGTLKVGLPPPSPGKEDQIPLRVRRHASHPASSTHSLLMTPTGIDDSRVFYLVPMDLTFILSSPVNLSLLASKTTTLQKLLRYVKQTQIHIAGEWQAARELPNRFMLGIQEDLQKLPGGPKSIVEALYHSVVTGHTYPVVQEWLVDSLAERGHKRWDKAVTAGLESVRDLVHENMIPALERCGIVLSRLLGLARFHSYDADIGFTIPQITRLMDIIACLTLVSNKTLLLAMEELELFAAFSTWLRFHIDQLASSSTQVEEEEVTEKEATMDIASVLAYIEHHLTSSPLGLYFDKAGKEDWTKDWELLEDGPSSLLDMLDKQLQKQESGAAYMKAFPQVEFLVDYLSSCAGAVFKDIAEAERRSVRFGKPTRLEIGSPVSTSDLRMTAVAKEGDGIDGLTFTALASEADPSQVYIFRTEITIINGISSASSTSSCGLVLGGDGAVADVKFLDDEVLLVLWTWVSQDHAPRLFAIPVQSPKLDYAPYEEGGAIPLRAVSNSGSADHRTGSLSLWSVDLPVESGFSPIQMEVVAANSARGEIPARVCLLGADKTTYKVYALPADLKERLA